MSDKLSKLTNFKRRQFTMTSWRQTSQLQRSEGNAFQRQHFMSDACHQATDFAVLSFLEFQFQNGAVATAFENPHTSKAEKTFGKVHAFAKLMQDIGLRKTGDETAIAANDFESRVSQLLCKIAVIRDKQHPFGTFVQSTNGEQPLVDDRNQIDGSRTSLRI